jgi:threonine/homoserine/homoserine lactone efflux protein
MGPGRASLQPLAAPWASSRTWSRQSPGWRRCNGSAIAFQTLSTWAYLLYLAWQTWRDPSPLEADQQAAPQSEYQLIRTAVPINVLNPKLTIFSFALLPQLASSG